jgi:arylsulfatase
LQFAGLAGAATLCRALTGGSALAGGAAGAAGQAGRAGETGNAGELASAAASDNKPGAGAPPRKPNFLIVVADDMGYSDPGCYGGEVQTPVLDGLADNGIRFTQCYSTARCWPSRTCLLTGYYAQQVRMDPPHGTLPAWARLLPHYLKPSGYRCYTSGKWHIRNAPKPIANGGFDRSYVLHDHDHNFGPKQHELDDKPLPPVPAGTDFYTTTAIAGHALDFLKQHAKEHASEPFLMYLAFTTPHFPLQAPPQDIAKYAGKYKDGWDACRRQRWQRMTKMGLINCKLSEPDTDIIPSYNLPAEKLTEQIGPGEVAHAVPWKDLTDAQQDFQAVKMSIHAAMVDRNDQEMGRVIEQIKAMGAFENTVIIFVSDNGASAEQIIRGDKNDKSAPAGSAKSFLCLGPGWSTASNTPFRLHKNWVHEGGIASPLVVHWPAGIKARGELRHTPCHFVDLVPTLVELAGGAIDPLWNGLTPPAMPGKGLAAALAADVAINREFLYFHHMDHKALRVGDWKIVSLGGNKPWELYDMRTDRCESDNLASNQPQRVEQMAEMWKRLDDEYKRQADPDGPPGKAGKAKGKQ